MRFRTPIGISLILVLAACFLVCDFAFGADAPGLQQAETWAKLPTAKWPQLVLNNQATFEGHTSLEGASAFLVRMPDGLVYLGTAKHLIKEPGGVNPPIPINDLDKVLQTWRAFPRTKPTLFVEGKGRAVTINGESTHDWLLLRLTDSKGKLPAAPLTVRLKPAEVGETVYLVGVPYSDPDSSQNVYKGVVTGRPGKHYFTYEFSPPVHIAGFSGAPIVDVNGQLLGHGVSRESELKQKDGLEIEFGGEDAALAVQLWQHRDDPPAPRPIDVVHIDLPAGWAQKTLERPRVLKLAEYSTLNAYFEVIGEARADFDEDVDLMAWAKLVKSHTTESLALASRRETDLTANKRGSRATVEYEMTGEAQNLRMHFRIIMLEINGCFCEVICWTTPDHWDAAQPKFDEVVRALR